jgi:hypothetical protein
MGGHRGPGILEGLIGQEGKEERKAEGDAVEAVGSLVEYQRLPLIADSPWTAERLKDGEKSRRC